VSIKKVVAAYLLRTGLVLLSVLLALSLSEAGIRLYEHLESNPLSGLIGPTSNPYAFYQFDPKLGWRNTPGAAGIFKRWEFEFPVRINKFGMRSKEVNLEPAPGIFRIAVLGDSFTWGLGVPDEERFTELLDRPGKTEVLNFGVSGYGPVQYSLMVDDVLRFKPNMIIVCFCLENDLLDNVLGFNYGYFHPYYELSADGKLVLFGYPLQNIKTLRQRQTDHIAAIFKKDLGGLSKLEMIQILISQISSRTLDVREPSGVRGFTSAMIYHPEQFPREPEEQWLNTAILINKKIFALIKEKTAAHNVSLLVVTAPSKREYGGCKLGSKSEIDWNSVNDLRRSLDGLEIPLLDTTQDLDCSDFWRFDGHWNPQGHWKIARAIAHWLHI
jgi:lysophospholipase L1-like esterase